MIKSTICILCILLLIFEYDRWFGGRHYPIYQYYIRDFPLPIIGLYNTIIRITNPSHTHKFDPNNFNSLKLIENSWKDIQKESMYVYSIKDTVNVEDITNEHWKVFVLKWYDAPLEAETHCPITVSLIKQCPDIHAAMFTILEPGGHIPPHKGPFTGCVRYHLGLKIPKDRDNCYIKVANEKFHWEEGKSFIFDDTYEHSVYNNTNEARMILFIDIERQLYPPLKQINHHICKQRFVGDFNKNINGFSEDLQS